MRGATAGATAAAAGAAGAAAAGGAGAGAAATSLLAAMPTAVAAFRRAPVTEPAGEPRRPVGAVHQRGLSAPRRVQAARGGERRCRGAGDVPRMISAVAGAEERPA